MGRKRKWPRYQYASTVVSIWKKRDGNRRRKDEYGKGTPVAIRMVLYAVEMNILCSTFAQRESP